MTATNDQDIDIVTRWLEAKGCTLWQQWDITDPLERREAADWFLRQCDDLNLFANQLGFEPIS